MAWKATQNGLEKTKVLDILQNTSMRSRSCRQAAPLLANRYRLLGTRRKICIRRKIFFKKTLQCTMDRQSSNTKFTSLVGIYKNLCGTILFRIISISSLFLKLSGGAKVWSSTKRLLTVPEPGYSFLLVTNTKISSSPSAIEIAWIRITAPGKEDMHMHIAQSPTQCVTCSVNKNHVSTFQSLNEFSPHLKGWDFFFLNSQHFYWSPHLSVPLGITWLGGFISEKIPLVNLFSRSISLDGAAPPGKKTQNWS